MRTLPLLAALLLAAAPAHARPYKLDDSSQLTFSGVHAGNPFTGRFENWSATIDFDAQKPETSSLRVTFETASATTGNSMYDGTIPSADWFNAKAFPQAEFTSTAISKNPDGSFTAAGNLRIRDKTNPVSFTFTLTPPDASGARVNAAFTLTLDRLAYDVGAKSDPKAEWVDKEIKVEGKIVATPQ